MHPSKPLTYARNLRAVLEAGNYDVVHSHVHHFSGWILRTAAQAGVPVRIAHSHSDTSSLQAQASPLRRIYLKAMQCLIYRYATHRLSASQLAAAALFGHNWKTESHHLLYCGIDTMPFGTEVDGLALRAGLGIAENTFVVGHVGRFSEPKNHAFLIQIVAEVCKREPDICFLLVGDGPLRPQIEQQVAQAGLNERVIFAGLRDDVPALLKGLMNAFLFPSLYEGLPVALIEVQAAGLSAVISDTITEETDLIKPLLQRLSLKQPVEVWAQAVVEFTKRKETISKSETLQCIQNSRFNIKQSIDELMMVYNE